MVAGEATMPSQFALETLDILLVSLMMVVAVGTIVMSVVGALTYFLTREPLSRNVARPSVVAGRVVTGHLQALDAPAAMAG
jgi:hypothetical protein